MVNLIPMAGAGGRFVRAGYALPKPLIRVSGLPMAVQAARALPAADRWVFVVLAEHVREHGLDRVLEQHFPGCRVLSLDQMTQGQACTCLLAEPLVAPDESLCIGACDNGMLWNAAGLERLWNTPQVDAILFTFRRNPTVARNPTAYGWVRVDAEGRALGVSCKVPLSDSPMEDHAIVGTFWFRRAALFFDAVRTQMAENRRVNGEFYIDVTMDVLIRQGADVRVFEIDHYIGWGTPEDLRTYEYWESCFRRLWGLDRNASAGVCGDYPMDQGAPVEA